MVPEYGTLKSQNSIKKARCQTVYYEVFANSHKAVGRLMLLILSWLNYIMGPSIIRVRI